MKKIPFRNIFLVIAAIVSINSLNRDFVTYQRYANFGQWVNDLIPATFGLVLAIIIFTIIVLAFWVPISLIRSAIKKRKDKK